MSIPLSPYTSQLGLELPFGPVDSCVRHRALLAAAAAMPLAPITDNRPPPEDIFGNPPIPTSRNVYLPHDLCTLNSAGDHVQPCRSPDPSIWRSFTRDETLTFVRPKDVGLPSKVPTPKPIASSSAYSARLPYRPTLDEFMASRESFRDSDTAPGSASSTKPGRAEHTGPAEYESGVTKRTVNLKQVNKASEDRRMAPYQTAARVALHDSMNEPSHLSSTGKHFPCPFDDCNQVCNNKGDLRRHLQTRKHQAAAILCQHGCGRHFTRKDAEKRHADKNTCI
ncbi:hypothetical protein D9615_005729 [Tricholomella constricta]|uniref:C2H2-type domain-containing protein n=1 Tax=Tricholomella constricta TaxID=117010 RepID=A0A8H5HAR3_9AGAR|nr:hypothetical protein D9615_005729 [Tricholomella constricta]